MATGILLPNGKQAFTDANSRPLAGGQVFFYQANTLTPKDTYQDPAMTILNTNPVILDARGEATIFGTGAYRQILKDASAVTIWDKTLPDILASVADAIAVFQGQTAVVAQNIAALKALDKTTVKNALVQGYYARGDGGGGQYYYDSTDTTSPDNGGTIIVATDGGRWKLIWSGQISVRQFGAKGDNATDDKVAIQATIDAIAAAAGGIVYFPQGKYVIASALAWTASSVTLKGANRLASQIIASFAAGDIITVGSAATNPNNCEICDLLIGTSVTRTSGAGIRFKNGHNLSIYRIRSENMFTHVTFDGGANQFIYTLSDFEFNNGGRGIFLGSDGTLIQDIFIDGGLLSGMTGDGVTFKNVSGLYMSRVDAINCKNGYSSFPLTGEVCTACWFSEVLADTCTDTGWLIQNGGGIVASWHLWACWASTCGGTNVNTQGFLFSNGTGTTRVINMDNPVAIANAGNGMSFLGVESLTITNPNVGGNSLGASGTRPGIQIGTGMAQWTITGGKVGIGAPYSVAASQSYGISISAGCESYSIMGVALNGNAIAGIQDLSTPADGTIAGCPAYATSTRGVATVAIGASSSVVNHGLPFTPVVQDINLTFAGSPSASGVASCYVTAVTSTQFTINTNALVATTALPIAWQARRRGN